jgi:hypothetical protein
MMAGADGSIDGQLCGLLRIVAAFSPSVPVLRNTLCDGWSSADMSRYGAR